MNGFIPEKSGKNEYMIALIDIHVNKPMKKQRLDFCILPASTAPLLFFSAVPLRFPEQGPVIFACNTRKTV